MTDPTFTLINEPDHFDAADCYGLEGQDDLDDSPAAAIMRGRDEPENEARLQRLGVWRSLLASPCDDVPFGPERLTLREHKQRIDDYVSALLRDDVDAASTAYQALQPLGPWWRSWADRLLFTVASPSLRDALIERERWA